MTTRLADPEGYVADALIAYYKTRALGGVGLVTVEMGSPEKAGRHRYHELGVYDDRFLPGLTRFVTTPHDAGARVSIQLGHGGSRVRKAVSGKTPIAPSSVPTSVYEVEPETVIPLEMTRARIEQTTQAFVEAAHRMQKAGFDFVELHAAHGYLISQFPSPSENHGTEEYAGSLENRASAWTSCAASSAKCRISLWSSDWAWRISSPAKVFLKSCGESFLAPASLWRLLTMS